MDDYSLWDAFKEMPDVLWGDSWTGIESFGRYIILLLGALIAWGIVAAVRGIVGDMRFRASARRRGGHVHVRYTDHGPGIGVIVGNVVVPTRNTSKTLYFAKGSKRNCRECRYG